ncbi:MAG: ABC transporter permease [Methanomicrobiales archaeon]|nr:ABC transporter permease [Methanomicrobiales archaeon]
MALPLFFQGALAVAGKNVRIYYTKPPVFIFGLLFPLFLFIAFFMGRGLALSRFYPGFLAMTLFFTASSVGPLITPWEKRDRTYERLLSYPLTIGSIILGDILAGALFGFAISLVILVASLLIFSLPVGDPFIVLAAFLLGTIAFATLGTLLASPASDTPATVMMLSTLVRLPLIFISGIFIPLADLGGAAQAVAYLSPLTYLVDLFQGAMNGTGVIGPATDLAALLAYFLLFGAGAVYFQRRNVMKGL